MKLLRESSLLKEVEKKPADQGVLLAQAFALSLKNPQIHNKRFNESAEDRPEKGITLYKEV